MALTTVLRTNVLYTVMSWQVNEEVGRDITQISVNIVEKVLIL